MLEHFPLTTDHITQIRMPRGYTVNLLVCLLITAVCREINGHACPENEHFEKCGTACEATCDSAPIYCTQECVEGCFCNSGFVRGPYRKCVRPEECPGTIPECPDGEYFSECGTACEETCEKRPDVCTLQCIRGCFCNPGLIRGPNHSCISPDECPGKDHELLYC
ncbi:serine protease inhibitor swm-1-like [Tachypleus tridentatus]|uniref:serine protease inhibitor swm-1-like n=1 Tax=Tachypleus tridentatus TaxID=6853 RepID=UPI003FD04833